jgi:gliding motility-associated-like protein
MPDDEIYVFCSPDVNGNAVTGSLSATPTISGPGFTFDWGLYDDVTHGYNSFQIDNGPNSTINNLASGGYSVTITNNAGESETFVTWLYVSIVDVDISLDFDPVHPGCEPFDVNGTIDASGFTYWDPLEPGSEPFIVDATTTIEVCFSANHTYVSDIGFVLIGPPSCGSPAVTLMPNPQVVAAANGCCCNSNNNINNLCFSTANNNQINVCALGGNLSGTYGFYNGGYPGIGGVNYPQGGVAGLYGCNAAEGGWAVQIYDCIGADIGALTSASITFSNGTSTIEYDSGAINSAINDNSCDPATASIYVVPLTTPINPDPQQVPNSGTLTYQLGLNGAPVTLLPGTNSFTETVDPIPNNDEWYYLSIQDELGCAAVDSALFDFTGYADATIDDVNPANLLCLANAPVQLTSIGVGGTYTGNGVSPTGMFDPVAAGIGVHTITHTIPAPCGDVQTIDIEVGNVTFTEILTDANCFGANTGEIEFTNETGTAPHTYSIDNGGTTQTTGVFADLSAGDYDLIITDDDGCVSQPLAVTINEPTEIVAVATMDAESSCGLPDGEVSVAVNGGTVAIDYTYSWDSNPVQLTAIATTLLPNTYTVTVTDDNGCTETSTIEVTQTPGFTASIISSTDALCFEACDGTATVQVGAGSTGALSYSWNSTPVQSTMSATALCAGTYQVTIADNIGCEATADITIGQPLKVTASVLASASPICIGESSDLTSTMASGTPPYGNYFWTADPADGTLVANLQNPTISPTVTTQYTFVGEDANGCSSEPVAITVTVHPPLSLNVTRPLFGPDTAICPYDFAVLDLQGSGGDGYYNYFLQPDLLNPATFPMQVQPAATTNYGFVVTDGCTTPPAFAASNVTVHFLPEVDFIADELTGCDPHTIELTDLTDPTPAIWNWNFGDVGSSANTSPLQNPSHQFSTSGLFDISLSVVTAEGCVEDSVKLGYIEVYPLPYASYSMNPEVTNVLAGTINFTDLSVGNIDTWEWDFGTGEISQNQNPVYNYTDTGTFLVWMQVTTDMGCEDETTREVTIEPDFMFYVPNSFTPNGDGQNDYFRGYGEGIKWETYELSVYNRWGEEIFVTNDIENPWRGWFKSFEAEAGVYVWKIRLYDQKGESHIYRGHVTLVR